MEGITIKKFGAALDAVFMLTGSIGYATGEYDSYIVKLKEEYNPQNQLSVALLSADVSSSAVEIISDRLNLYTVSGEVMDYIDMSAVEYIEPNYRIVLLEDYPDDPFCSSYYQWGLPIVNAPYAWEHNYFGENIRVGVIDSGVDLEHPDLMGRIKAYKDYTGSGTIAEWFTGYNANENNLHGTSVAGAIGAGIGNGEGIAGTSKADIVSLKVIHKEGDIGTLIEALEDATDTYSCSVVNISMGVFDQDDNPVSGDNLQAYKEAIDYATENGVIVVAASGNSGKEEYIFPASFDNVISVGGVGYAKKSPDDKIYVDANGRAIFENESDKKKKISFSTYNSMIDIVAPGMSIYLPMGNYNRVAGKDYDWQHGTSFSSPQVAGAAAIVKGINPEFDHDSFEALIKFTAEDLGDKGKDDYYGWGLLNIEEMVKLASGERLGTAEPVYDAATQKLSLTYADFGAATGSESVRAAVYNADDTLAGITSAIALPQPGSDGHTINMVVDGVEIPNGGYIKVYCMSDWAKMIPAANIVTYKN